MQGRERESARCSAFPSLIDGNWFLVGPTGLMIVKVAEVGRQCEGRRARARVRVGAGRRDGY